MLVSVNSIEGEGLSIKTDEAGVGELLEREWLLSNSRGGYSSSTMIGCNTRRYHALLAGSLNPPSNRIVGLSNCLETISIGGETAELSSFEFDGAISPAGYRYMTEFHKDIGVHFDYDLGPLKLTKSVYLLADYDVVAVVYDFFSVYGQSEFCVRPFIGMRDFHSLQNSSERWMYSVWEEEGVAVKVEGDERCKLFLRSDEMWFEEDKQWWYKFFYRKEHERGQDSSEDLWSPGMFKCRIDSPSRVVFWAGLGENDRVAELADVELETVIDALLLREKELGGTVKGGDKTFKGLCSAAGQFVVERQTECGAGCTILAGFPWFLDWGRDAFISLRGLLLSTGRFAEAASILTTFAEAVDEGMIPNRFDDYGGEAHYNSIDSSLWFVFTAFEYLKASKNNKLFSTNILPALRWVIDRYHEGTRFGIHADTDGLITGGDENTQLTWMDAKCEGVAFTPRYGKAVEVNALWYNCLCEMSRYYGDKDVEAASHYGRMAEKVMESFMKVFWNEEKGYLNDCVLPDGRVDSSCRPNQIYAVSLGWSPLTTGQQRKVVDVVQRELLTPFGLRTLNRSSANYIGRYEGGQMERDRAYHQGTVWPFLIGGFVEAYLRINDFSLESKKQARNFLEPLLNHFTETGCVGSISEIFDGDEPQRPRGCIAQAWSVGEVLRAYMLIND